MKTNYAKILRDRAEQARQDRLDASPIGLTEYRARRAREIWRAKFAAYMSLAGPSPGVSSLPATGAGRSGTSS